MKKNTVLSLALLSVVAAPSVFGLKLDLKDLRKKFQEIKKIAVKKIKEEAPGAITEVKKLYAKLNEQVKTIMNNTKLSLDEKFAQLKALAGQSRQALNLVKKVIGEGIAKADFFDIHNRFKDYLGKAKLKVDNIGQ